ncbi:hypothetical protein [Parasphingorhabdus sp.]|uniref:hypothetical protein n=1 Tax=Parasphingorhabdus sp. TaxID=2709688 RepID=UPI003A92DA91
MILSFALAILAAGQTPQAFTAQQSQDIGCAAVLSIIAEEQRRNAPGATDYPDVRQTAARWTTLVMDRIAKETKQSTETVRTAIWDAVMAEQEAVRDLADPKAYVDKRMAACLPLMRADLLAQTHEQ